MQIGRLAKRVGVTTQAIRYYERIGLLGRTDRSPSGYRIFGEETEGFLRFLKKAQTLGFTLPEIKSIWEIRATGKKPCGYVKEQAKKKVLELSQKIRTLEELRQSLIDIQHDSDPPELSQQDEIHCVCPLIEGIQLIQQHENGGCHHGTETKSRGFHGRVSGLPGSGELGE